jgi:hypothetical protein
MDREYDLFELMPDGSVEWHECLREKDQARRRLDVLNRQTGHRCFAIDLWTNEIVASASEAKAKVA